MPDVRYAPVSVREGLYHATYAFDVVRGYWWDAIRACVAAGLTVDDLVDELGMSAAEINRELAAMQKNERNNLRLRHMAEHPEQGAPNGR